MKTLPSATEHWPPVGTGIWMRWWGYLVRWLVFGLVVHVFQPVSSNPKFFWLEKLDQILIGLSFGLAGAVVFTVAENTFNTPRVNWKSWLIVLGSWLTVKVAFVSVGAALE
jgi:hypothetical protein